MSLPADLRERPYEAGDADALAALARACDETYLDWAPAGWRVPDIPAGWAQRFLGPERSTRVAVDAVGTLVASVGFRPAFDDRAPGPPSGPPLPGVAHVGIVFVHPSRWREGIARAMLGSAHVAMLERGYVRAQLWTPEGAPAERFYTALGWSRDGRRAWHPWVGLHVVGYARDLA